MARANNNKYNSNRNNSSSTKPTNGKPSASKPASANSKESKSSNVAQNFVSGASPAINNIINASSQIAIRNIAGNRVELPVSSEWSAYMSINDDEAVIPGVVQVAYAPLIGRATGAMTDPVNVSIRNVWMLIRSLYSNMIPYTADHIGKVLTALGSILMCFSYIKRIYGIVFNYDARNKYIPDGILAAMDVDAADIRQHIPDIRVKLNKVATQMTAFGVPQEFRFIFDHVFYTSNIYVDDATPNSQFIVPSPAFFWKMDWANDKLVTVPNIVPKRGEPISSTNWTEATPKLRTWAALEAILDDLVESFVNYEDVYVLASDFRRVYGDNDMFGINPVELDYAIWPVYDQNFLEEMHNATYAQLDYGNWEITSVQAANNVGALSANYSTGFTEGSAAVATDFNGFHAFPAFTPGMYDFNNPDPTVDQIIRTSNWKYWIELTVNTATATKIKIASSGTVAIANAAIYTLRSEKWAYLDLTPKMISSRPHVWMEGGGNLFDGNIALWNKHPLILQGMASGSAFKPFNVTWKHNFPLGDIDQYFTMGTDELKRVHDAIILDKLDAAGAGTLNKLNKKG